MAKDFNAAINGIMPLVNDGSDLPFALTFEKGDWNINYFAIASDMNPTRAEIKSESEKYLSFLRETDPLALMYTGADFNRASFSVVYDAVLYDRLRDEYYLAQSSGKDTDELHAMTCFMQDNIGAFSHTVTDYLTTLDRPLAALTEMCPFSLVTDKFEWSYNEDLVSNATDAIEKAVESRVFGEYSDRQSVKIGDISITLAEKPDSRSPYVVYNRLNGEAYNRSAFPGYVSAMREFTERQTILIDTLEAKTENRRKNDKKPSIRDRLAANREKIDRAEAEQIDKSAAKRKSRDSGGVTHGER